ncbi:MAG: epoxyqueuosine reductase QueH [Nitrospirota bacterium]
MHICCANCSLYPIQSLTSRGIDIKGLWLNPNIHPYTEYRLRLESLQKLQEAWNLEIEYIDNYGLKSFLRTVVNHEEDRCRFCYRMRLEETARTAKKMGLDGFTTTLLVSPYQKFDMIQKIGTDIGKQNGIPFFIEDFRPGWRKGMQLSREYGLYRQKYCGCVYSEMERYTKQ